MARRLVANLLVLTALCVLAVGALTWRQADQEESRNSSQLEQPAGRLLSRKRRYLVFPEGSSLQLVFCLTVPTLIPDTIFNLGWTLGVNWELPNDTRPFRRDPMLSHRMDRRDVYGKLEGLLKAMGMDGQACIMRALCEAGQRTGVPGEFIEEILHAIFKFPSSREFGLDEHLHYDRAHRTSGDCAEKFSDCPSSLADMAFE
ncbi:uncharacterized protein LOC134529163 [Bacillus rossius redtenbacheri]|uniref:uncharacterized protein LOC134529163 n=1 Tax=Bacillus rossius redtenbacheri TaxID=93214 RepID=UPI002FDD5A42